jgi:hypothetical protein
MTRSRRGCRHLGSGSRSGGDDSGGTAASSVARAGGRYTLKNIAGQGFHSKHDFNGSESAAGFGFEPDLLCSRPRIVYRVCNEAKGK